MSRLVKLPFKVLYVSFWAGILRTVPRLRRSLRMSTDTSVFIRGGGVVVGHRPKAYRHPVTIDVGLFSTGYLIGIV